MTFSKIAVLGLGKIGLLAANLLHEQGFTVTGCDQRLRRRRSALPVRPQDVSSQRTLG